jgi:hypothetical protein
MVGTSHARTGAPCQDAGRCAVVTASDGTEVLLVAVSDGAGSASKSEVGSALAVDMFLAEIGALAADDPDLSFLDRDAAVDWVGRLRMEIEALAAESGGRPDDYACTFLACVAGPRRTVCIQIGDGAIVVAASEVGDYSWVFWPQHGEFANSTNFVTQEDFEAALEVEFIDRPVDELAIFSDGIERLVLNMQSRTVHSPALTPMFGWLARLTRNEGIDGPAPALQSFLDSPRVNERTDDDKTLAMATRARPISSAG